MDPPSRELLVEMTSSDNHDIPPTVPPSQSHKEIFHKFGLFRNADRIAAEATNDPNCNIDETLTHLTKDLTSEAEKARAIFKWISRLLFVKAKTVNKDETTLAGLLNLIASGERTWSDVFALLCRKANLESVVLRGYCKRYTNHIPTTPAVNSHWTAVHVDGHWRLVHLLMAFRNCQMISSPYIKIESDGTACKDRDTEYTNPVDDNYFFTDPGDFIYVCRPEDDRWQLLDKPWDWKKYINPPVYRTATKPPAPTIQADTSIQNYQTTIEVGRVDSEENPMITVKDMEEGIPEPSPPKYGADINLKRKDFVNIDDRAKRVNLDAPPPYQLPQAEQQLEKMSNNFLVPEIARCSQHTLPLYINGVQCILYTYTLQSILCTSTMILDFIISEQGDSNNSKKGCFFPEKYNQGANAKVPVDKMKHYDDLFRYLFQDLTDNIQKVRAVFIWVGEFCNSNRVSPDELKDIVDLQTPLDLIKISRKYNLCSELCFAVLCRRANIPCVVVRGYSKRPLGYCFDGNIESCTLNESVWNAVYVNDNWRLINLRDAYSFETRKETIVVDIYGKKRKQTSIISQRETSDFFFMPNPEDMVHFCLPHNQDWQLLKKPISREKFVNQPVFYPEYFLSKWRLVDCDAIVHGKNGISELIFLNPFSEESNDQVSGTCLQDSFFHYDLFFREEDSENEFPDDLKISRHIFFKNDKNMRTVIVRFPVNGVYLLLFKNAANNKVCEVLLKCSGITGKQPEIPYSPELEKNGLGVVIDSRHVVQDSFKESIIEVLPGEKVIIPLIFKRRKGKKDNTGTGSVHSSKVGGKTTKTIGDDSAELKNYQASLVGSEGTLTDTKICVHSTPLDNEDYVRIAVQVPPLSTEIAVIVKAAIHGGEKENVANFLLTHDDRLQGRNWNKHTNEQKEEIRKLEKDGKKHTKVNPFKSRKLLQLYQREFVQAELFDDVKDLESVFAAAKKSTVAQDIHQTPWFAEARSELRNLRLENFKKKTTEIEKAINRDAGSKQENRQKLLNLFRLEFKRAIDLQDLEFLEELFALTKVSYIVDDIQQTLWFTESKKCHRLLQRQLFTERKEQFEREIMTSESPKLANHHRLMILYHHEFLQSLEYDDRKDLEELFVLARNSNVLYFMYQTPWYCQARERLRELRRQHSVKKKQQLETAFRMDENQDIKHTPIDFCIKEFIPAQDSGSVDDQQYALKSASESALALTLKCSVHDSEAVERPQLLKSHSCLTAKVDEPSVKIVEEIRSLVRPHKLVENIVKATFLILGEKKKHLCEWRQVQTLLRERDSLIERMKNTKAEEIQTRYMHKASKLLGTCSLQDIFLVSPSAAALYNWLKSLIDQKIQHSVDTATDDIGEELMDDITDDETSDDTDDDNS